MAFVSHRSDGIILKHVRDFVGLATLTNKEIFSPVNAFVSGLLGKEMFRKVRQLNNKVENKKCLYLGKFLEI